MDVEGNELKVLPEWISSGILDNIDQVQKHILAVIDVSLKFSNINSIFMLYFVYKVHTLLRLQALLELSSLEPVMG